MSSQTYQSEENDGEEHKNDTDYDSMVSQAPTSHASTGTNNTLFEAVPIEIDTECLLLLGLLFCRDRQNQKASIFYSLLRGASVPCKIHGKNFEELNCMDEAVESITFKLCVLSSMFIEYHALPARAGKTEIKMLHLAFAMRTSVFLAVFHTFIQHVCIIPE